jgi:hypothetical protein
MKREHVGRWTLAQTTPDVTGTQWCWVFRCTCCGRTETFVSLYPPASRRHEPKPPDPLRLRLRVARAQRNAQIRAWTGKATLQATADRVGLTAERVRQIQKAG